MNELQLANDWVTTYSENKATAQFIKLLFYDDGCLYVAVGEGYM